MVSAFASQLQAIARNSSNELDLKAQRNAHAESLLFDKAVAVKQDFETIYNICLEGFYELCSLDSRFHDFERNVFSEQSKTQDREHMTKAENQALDLVLKRFLSLIGSKLLLSPAIKTLEWLVRRFRVHVHNVDDLLHTLLPYHELQIWATALSIVPEDKIVGQWKFVRPYFSTTWTVPRHAVAHAAAHNDAFFSGMNQYVLETCRQGLSHAYLMKHWSSIVVEAVSSRSIQTLSGRKEVQKMRSEDQLLKILPLLSDAFEIPGSSDLITACYAVIVVVVSKIDLDDRVLDSLLLAAATSMLTVDGDATSAIITISIIAMRKVDAKMPKKVLEAIAHLQNFAVIANSLAPNYPIRRLILLLIDSAVAHIKVKNANQMALACEKFVHTLFEISPSQSTSEAFQPMLSKVLTLDASKSSELAVRDALLLVLQRMNEPAGLSVAMSEAMLAVDKDHSELENMLGVVINIPQPPSKLDTEMKDDLSAEVAKKDLWDTLPHTWEAGSSFLAASDFSRFAPVAAAFMESYARTDLMNKFLELPLWSSVRDGTLLRRTFWLRLACSKSTLSTRIAALNRLNQSIKDKSECDPQLYVPYALVLLADEHKAVRQTASSLLIMLQAKLAKPHTTAKFSSISEFYDDDRLQVPGIDSYVQLAEAVATMISPILEECILDGAYILNSVRKAIHSSSSAVIKKSYRKALQTLITQHAISTQVLRVKVALSSMLIDQTSKNSTFGPIYHWWSSLSEDDMNQHIFESGLETSQVDVLFTRLLDLKDTTSFSKIISPSTESTLKIRPTLLRALFDSLRHRWSAWNPSEKLSVGQGIFELAFSNHPLISSHSRELLQAIDIPSGILALFLQIAQTGSSELKGPPPSKKKRRSSSNQQSSRERLVKDIDVAIDQTGLALELVDSNHPELKPELLASLFETLAHLKRLQEARISSPYMVNLCLSSIRVILRRAEIDHINIDMSGVRSDLVTDCLRSFDNIQVQSAALLVCASLSHVAADSMLHNVMSIFAFIGNTISAKDDEHSLNVVNEAVDKIVPALVGSLKKAGQDPMPPASLATVLTSFTSAYNHFPLHRRVAFYQRLIVRLGSDEFGYLLIAMLSVQNSGLTLDRFLQDVISGLDANSQLLIFQQLAILALDVLSISPKFSGPFLNISQTSDSASKTQIIRSILKAGAIVLETLAQKTKTINLTSLEGYTIDTLPRAFGTTLDLIKHAKEIGDDILTLSKRCLILLLNIPSLSNLIEMLTVTINELENDLQPLALQALASQLTNTRRSDRAAKDAALQFLTTLERYIRHRSETVLLLSSLDCVERICQAYGRKDLDAVLAVAQMIVDRSFVGSEMNDRLRAPMILTLTSVVEVLKEASIPVIPSILSQISEILTPASLTSVIDAACLLLSAIISYAPFMVDELQLKGLVTAISVFHYRKLPSMGSSDMDFLLDSIAKRLDLETILATSLSIMQDENKDVAGSSTNLLLEVCTQAIGKSSKARVMKESSTISRLLVLILESQSMHDTVKLSEIERTSDQDVSTALKSTSIAFIYKINDTTLRPIFESWVDWSTSATGPNNHSNTDGVKWQVRRQIILFDLLTHFFETLKAIVTSYASYLVRPITTILTTYTPSTKDTSKSSRLSAPIPLICATLTLFKTIATHDADGFLSAPSYFDTLSAPLVNALTLSARKSTRSIAQSHTIPAIIALATATQDSPSTHSTLATQIVALRRHTSSHVRHASIQTLLAITEYEDIGDEFLANTIGIGGGGEGKGARGGGSSAGDIMIYVNEMVEDDDDNVERSVRLWVQKVRAKIGEEIFAE